LNLKQLEYVEKWDTARRNGTIDGEKWDGMGRYGTS